MPRGKHLTKREINTMIEMHQQGFTGVKIAKTLGRSNQSVSKVLSRFKAGQLRDPSTLYKTINATQEDWKYVTNVAKENGIHIRDALTLVCEAHATKEQIAKNAVEQIQYLQGLNAGLQEKLEATQKKKKKWWHI